MPVHNQSGWHETPEYSHDDACRFVRRYLEAVNVEDWTQAVMREKWVVSVIRDRPELMTPDLYKELVLPFLNLQTLAGRHDDGGFIFGVINIALASPDCPPEILTKATRCVNRAYAKIAADNPACPEEDQVYVALKNQ